MCSVVLKEIYYTSCTLRLLPRPYDYIARSLFVSSLLSSHTHNTPREEHVLLQCWDLSRLLHHVIFANVGRKLLVIHRKMHLSRGGVGGLSLSLALTGDLWAAISSACHYGILSLTRCSTPSTAAQCAAAKYILQSDTLFSLQNINTCQRHYLVA